MCFQYIRNIKPTVKINSTQKIIFSHLLKTVIFITSLIFKLDAKMMGSLNNVYLVENNNF